MADRCRWIDDPVLGLWHLPGCWGAINGGPEGCICDPEDEAAEREDFAGRMDKIEARMDVLIGAVVGIQDAVKALLELEQKR